MILSLIVAMSENGVIGRAGKLPWHLPTDLKRFKQLTTDHTIIMGRKTFDSIGKPLAQRRNIVISRNRLFRAPGAEAATSLDAAIALCHGDDEVFIIGGAEIFRAAMPGADRLYLTLIHANIEGDVYFPEMDRKEWTLIDEVRIEADAKNAYPMDFQRYVRVRFASGQGPI